MKNRIKKGIICSSIQPKNYLSPKQMPEQTILEAGDIALFEVLSIGKHKSLQTTTRNTTLMPGDLILAAFGTRYATNQFEGYVPDHLMDEYHLLGGGGVVGILESTHARYEERGPTRLKMIGLGVDSSGKKINTINQASKRISPFTGIAASKTKVILSLGSSMDSGKTTTAAFLCHGFSKKGLRAAYIKLTGTAYPKDKNFAFDLGASSAYDFSSFGYPSTYMRSEVELLNLYESLLQLTSSDRPDYVVVEIADGLFQRETRMLLRNPVFMSTVHQVVFSAGDSLSAVHGVETLMSWGIVPSALSGLFTASPLLIKETKEYLYEKQDLLFLPILNLEDLAMGNWPIVQEGVRLLQA